MPLTHDSKPFVFVRGPLIVSCESLFWHWQRYPSRSVARHTPPLTEVARPRELEQPYRRGHGRAFRLPLTRRALVVGWWEPAGEDVLAEEESDKLLEAVEGAHVPGITATEIADWAGARDWTWLQRLLRRLRWRLGLRAPAREAVAAVEEELPGWEAEQGWSLRPWDPMDVVLDLEQARTHPPVRS